MLKRRIQRCVEAFIRQSPVVALLGPRQVGKTTLALNVAKSYPSIYLDLEMKFRERWAIEVKRSAAPTLSKGFYTACEDVNATKRFVVYEGQETFTVGKKVKAISLNGLMAEIAKFWD